VSAVPFLRHLTAAEVREAMPPVDERLELAERTLVALATPGAAELPAKIGVHPRPEGSFAHAMPAHLRARAAPADDLLGMKWVAGFDANKSHGLPAISALVVLNDSSTGLPIAILDGGPITAERTAAVSGVAIRRFAPLVKNRPIVVGLIGAGVQGHSHLAVLRHLLPAARLRVHDRHPERAAALCEAARAAHGFASAEPVASARAAVERADVVITAVSFTDATRRQAMTGDWLAPDALVVPVDYATMCAAAVAHDAALFLVDQREQFLAARATGQFEGYPEPGATLGEAIAAGTARPARGRVVATHLGVGLADVVFGAAILERAAAMGLGRELPR